jgi:hypothetical protein
VQNVTSREMMTTLPLSLGYVHVGPLLIAHAVSPGGYLGTKLSRCLSQKSAGAPKWLLIIKSVLCV